MNSFACEVIDRLGGTTAVAKICECKAPSVHDWRTYGIPKARLMFLKLLHPEAFVGLEEPKKNLATEQESV